MKEIEPPEQSILEETFLSATEVAIPVVMASLGLCTPTEALGTVIAETIKFPLNIARNRKFNKFCKELSDAIANLSSKVKSHGLAIDNLLKENENLIEIIDHAIIVAVNQERKIGLLKNAVINSIIEIDIDHEQKIQFIQYIGELSTIEVSLLNFFIDKSGKVSKIKCYRDLYNYYIENISKNINLCNIVDRDEFRAHCNRLSARYLLNVPYDFEEVIGPIRVVTDDGEKYEDIIRATSIGHKFMQFIEEYKK